MLCANEKNLPWRRTALWVGRVAADSSIIKVYPS